MDHKVSLVKEENVENQVQLVNLETLEQSACQDLEENL
jgi:hypothetical protein